jgi:hypothetical protein
MTKKRAFRTAIRRPWHLCEDLPVSHSTRREGNDWVPANRLGSFFTYVQLRGGNPWVFTGDEMTERQFASAHDLKCANEFVDMALKAMS